MCGPFFDCVNTEFVIYNDKSVKTKTVEKYEYGFPVGTENVRYVKLYHNGTYYHSGDWDNGIEGIYEYACAEPEILLEDDLTNVSQVYQVCYLVEKKDDDLSFIHFVSSWMSRNDPIKNILPKECFIF
jgi:hypothetical protein